MPSRRSYVEDSRTSLTEASERAARVFGIVFILIGIALIVFLIGGFIMSKLGYRTDPNLPIPTLDSIDAYTNEDALDVSGTVLPGETVVLYVDDTRTTSTAETDDEGNFVFTNIPLEEEGEASFMAAVVRGSLFKRRSEFSNTVTTTVDWTAPATDVSLDYTSVSTSSSGSISGTIEPHAIVVIEGNGKIYEVTADGDGMFDMKNVTLVEGLNTFSVRIRDQAGNEVTTSKQIKITYEAGSINGDGASTGDGEQLPESAGELDAALEFLAGNKLMLGMAVLVLVAFGGSARLARLKYNRK